MHYFKNRCSGSLRFLPFIVFLCKLKFIFQFILLTSLICRLVCFKAIDVSILIFQIVNLAIELLFSMKCTPKCRYAYFIHHTHNFDHQRFNILIFILHCIFILKSNFTFIDYTFAVQVTPFIGTDKFLGLSFRSRSRVRDRD